MVFVFRYYLTNEICSLRFILIVTCGVTSHDGICNISFNYALLDLYLFSGCQLSNHQLHTMLYLCHKVVLFLNTSVELS